ncbi:MAG: chromosomal replication initiator protein DnaA [Candidatus Saccharibacteria bacterium]
MLVQETDVWQAVLGEIELSVPHGSYVTWFKPTRLLKIKDDTITIGVSNVFAIQQMEKKYSPLLKEILAKNGLTPKHLEFKIHSGLGAKKQPKEDVEVISEDQQNNQLDNQDQAPKTPAYRTNALSHSYRQGLNERYTFDNFVVGSGNELAYAACQAIAVNPGTKYNPLFLYGGAGIGKTHLIQAAGNAVVARKKDARVVYASSEQFVQEFADALRYKKNTDFANHYRSVDVFIMDDVQFLAGKERVQDEFFHTFNALHQANKQIIISSDKPPGDIPTLEDRLKSRFTWGMSIDMQNPDFETRCAIIHIKASAHGLDLKPDLVEYMSNLFQTNIRELEGALNQLLAFCEMRGLEPDLLVATGLLGSRKSRPKHISAKQIIERTAKHFQVSMEDIVGPKRDKDIVVPRQVAMYILRSELHLSFPKIARELGRKDHTTAIHSVDKIDKELAFDTDMRAAINEIKERLYV